MKPNSFLMLFLFGATYALETNDCLGQDTLISKNYVEFPKVRIDLDFSFLFSASASLTYSLNKKNALGIRSGLGFLFVPTIKNYSFNKFDAFYEIAKLDLFHKFIFTDFLELDNGLRASVLYYVKKGESDESYSIGGNYGFYLQPMIGLKHFKIGSLLFVSFLNNFTPIYYYPVCLRCSLTF